MKETNKKKQSASNKHKVKKKILKNTHTLIATMQELYFHSLLILSREVYTSGLTVLSRPFSREAQPVIVDEI